MAYGELHGHVIDDVTSPRNVKLVTPICLESNIEVILQLCLKKRPNFETV